MLNTQEKLYHATKELLRTFDALPACMIKEWLCSVDELSVKEKDFIGFLKTMSGIGEIYFNRETDYCSLYYGQQADLFKDCEAFVCMRALGKGEHRIARASYPFDYILEHNHVIYQIINFENEGRYKLRFRKNMDEAHTISEDIVPIIILINRGNDDLCEQDSRGRYSLIPDCDYLIAHVTLKPMLRYEEAYSVSFTRHKGGTI